MKRFTPNNANLLVDVETRRDLCCIGRVREPAEFKVTGYTYGMNSYPPRQEVVCRAGDLVVFRNDAGIEALPFGENARIISWNDVLGKAEGFDA